MTKLDLYLTFENIVRNKKKIQKLRVKKCSHTYDSYHRGRPPRARQKKGDKIRYIIQPKDKIKVDSESDTYNVKYSPNQTYVDYSHQHKMRRKSKYRPKQVNFMPTPIWWELTTIALGVYAIFRTFLSPI